MAAEKSRSFTADSTMDAATVLEEYLSDLTNLPTDLAYILDEIHSKEEKLQEAQKRVSTRDGAIQKHLKSQGSLSEFPKEAHTYSRIRADFQESAALQHEKCVLANTGLYIISRQVKKLNDQIRQLEAEGLLVPAVSDDDDSRISPEPTKTVTSSRRQSELKRPAPPRDKTPSAGPPVKRQRTEQQPRRPHNVDEEETTYCICQQPSFGEMVACDNPNCQYEWFHWECVGLTETPTGTWYCPTCVAQRNRK